MQQDTEHNTLQALERGLPLAGVRVLEIGCGDGRVTAQYAHLPASITCVEPESAPLLKARNVLSQARFACCSGMELPFAADSFDVVLYTLSLHHHPDSEKALEQAAACLCSGGLIGVLEPCSHSHIQEFCSIVRNENIDLHVVEAVLGRTDYSVAARFEFDTRWVFDDFVELRDTTLNHYGKPHTPQIEAAMRDYLRDHADDTPLVLRDTLRLTCLRV
ncbi:class I SAM-dependent methyltransferase [Oleidesulfovibrio sp.]|uniref:class I SAM-dependent methyltransferase n=1 Tax=Oleidesulfovibrio sp. TaxID=2909707 RepID=UPI003A83AC1F